MAAFDPDLHEKIGTYASPTFGYRAVGGVVEKQIFDGVLPPGWFDSPANLSRKPWESVSRDTIAEVPKPRGRPKGSKNRV